MLKDKCAAFNGVAAYEILSKSTGTLTTLGFNERA